MRITSDETSILLTGDIGEIDEKILLQQGIDIKSNILKVGHHGSKYSTTKEFLKEVNPEIAVLSYGKNNSYGHPYKETMDKLQNQNIEIYETAEQGIITILIEEQSYTIEKTYSK